MIWQREIDRLQEMTDEDLKVLLNELLEVRRQRRMIAKENEVCTCSCHRIPGTMHMVPCCNRTYEQF